VCGGHQGWGGAGSCCCGQHWHHGCGGGHPFSFHHRFSTKEAEAAALDQYPKDIEDEAKGVRERFTELKGA
jgi:hypothetical protein